LIKGINEKFELTMCIREKINATISKATYLFVSFKNVPRKYPLVNSSSWKPTNIKMKRYFKNKAVSKCIVSISITLKEIRIKKVPEINIIPVTRPIMSF
jgi:hypothetical protein